jgi:phytoene dehydrogenase-like protein
MGGFAIRSKVFHTLPMGFVSLLSSGLLRAEEKLETARFLVRLRSLDSAPLQRVSVDDWLRQNIASNSVRELIAAVVRLTTYTNDPERLSAGAALQQVQQSFAGVVYLHDGWQTLVDRLRRLNEACRVRLFTGCRVKSVLREGKVRGVRLSDGRVMSSPIVVIADSPSTAMDLLKESRTAVTNWEDSAIPVRISCFDVALTSLPRPKALLALGIDQPIYASVHSRAARLAPNDGALIHVVRYGKPGVPPAQDTERELVAVLDGLQPGWRSHVVSRRFLPQLTVSHALVSVANGGLNGRLGPAVLDIPGLYLVGDWIGPEGMLADATLASARRAATEILSLPHPQRDENNGSSHEAFGARSL